MRIRCSVHDLPPGTHLLSSNDMRPSPPLKTPLCLNPTPHADGTSWGALLLNSNGMEVVATEEKLTFRAIGGMLDLVRVAG